MTAQKTLYITGVAGFLGSHLADHFLAAGHRVLGCDTLIGGYRQNVPEGVGFFESDILDLAAMRQQMKGVDVVVHAAALAYEGLSVFSPRLVTENIVGGSASVFSAAVSCGVSRVVFCSSMARYGACDVPFREEMTCRPQDPYGIGKVAAEDLLRNLGEVHGFDWAIAVPHNIIGPRQKYDDPFRNVASIMVNLMLQGRQPIIYGDGSQKRCFSYVADVVPGLARMALDESLHGATINVGPDEEFVSVLELATRIARLLDFPLDPVFVPARPQEVLLATCSADRARNLLGYRTEHTLDEGLSKVIEYVRNRGPLPFSYHLDVEILNEKTPATWTKQMF